MKENDSLNTGMDRKTADLILDLVTELHLLRVKHPFSLRPSVRNKKKELERALETLLNSEEA